MQESIRLTKGYVAVVDSGDADLAAFKWQALRVTDAASARSARDVLRKARAAAYAAAYARSEVCEEARWKAKLELRASAIETFTQMLAAGQPEQAAQ